MRKLQKMNNKTPAKQAEWATTVLSAVNVQEENGGSSNWLEKFNERIEQVWRNCMNDLHPNWMGWNWSRKRLEPAWVMEIRVVKS